MRRGGRGGSEGKERNKGKEGRIKRTMMMKKGTIHTQINLRRFLVNGKFQLFNGIENVITFENFLSHDSCEAYSANFDVREGRRRVEEKMKERRGEKGGNRNRDINEAREETKERREEKKEEKRRITRLRRR